MNIFITGATGFIGGKIIEDLLPQSDKIFVLARSEKKALELLEQFTEEQQKQIQVLYGDITYPDLGLSTYVQEKLEDQIDVLYHMAALVKFDQELKEELFAINYEGTKNTLKLAEKIKVKRFLHVSTAYTLGKIDSGEEKLYPLETPFFNPYEESKRLAEHEVFKYKDKMEVSIFRPAIVVGDSETGEANSAFTLYGFMRGIEVFNKRMKRRKTGESVYRVIADLMATSNFVPVDYVCKVLVAGLQHAEREKIYHIVNTNPPKNLMILDYIRERLDFPELTVTESLEGLREEEQYLNQLLAVFHVYLNRNIRFVAENTESLLKKAGENLLNMDEAMLKRIIMGYTS